MRKKIFKISIVITIFTALLLPCLSPKDMHYFLQYKYGVPFGFFTIYTKSKGVMLIPKLFNGNEGVHIKLLLFFLDIGVVYFIITKILTIRKKFKI